MKTIEPEDYQKAGDFFKELYNAVRPHATSESDRFKTIKRLIEKGRLEDGSTIEPSSVIEALKSALREMKKYGSEDLRFLHQEGLGIGDGAIRLAEGRYLNIEGDIEQLESRIQGEKDQELGDFLRGELSHPHKDMRRLPAFQAILVSYAHLVKYERQLSEKLNLRALENVWEKHH